MEYRIRHCWLAGLVLATIATVCSASWGTPDSSQYHIQTDEGPDRYFKYQTDNGQYRKERRLEDGTVIGTEAWIDASGYMRQKDYIADDKGYRILKSKTVFVGVNRPIQEAIKEAKKAPATAGTLVHPDTRATPQRKYIPPHRHVFSTTLQPATANPNPLGYDHYSSPNDLVPPVVKPLAVYLPDDRRKPITNNGEEASVYVTPRNNYTSRPSHSASVPSLDLQLPFDEHNHHHDHIREPIAVYGPPSVTPIPSYATSTVHPNAVEHFDNHIESVSQYDSVQPTTYRPKLTYQPAEDSDYKGRFDQNREAPLFDRNALRRRIYDQKQPLVSNNAIGNGYDPQYPYFDGVSDTVNGFRYYLPRQYHEEDNSYPERRAGSFGYIDPFGIRRVVYYNTSPEGGFVHRKNNRYVGFDATPYDPRPV